MRPILIVARQLEGRAGIRNPEQPEAQILQRQFKSQLVLKLRHHRIARRRPIHGNAIRALLQHQRADAERPGKMHLGERPAWRQFKVACQP